MWTHVYMGTTMNVDEMMATVTIFIDSHQMYFSTQKYSFNITPTFKDQ